MNQVNVKVAFYLKKSEADAKGNCPVMARLTVGRYSEAAFSLKMSVPQTMWLIWGKPLFMMIYGALIVSFVFEIRE